MEETRFFTSTAKNIVGAKDNVPEKVAKEVKKKEIFCKEEVTVRTN